MAGAANPVLVRLTRGGETESLHRGALALAAPDGRLAAAIGDVNAPVFPRSAYKMLQALPLVDSGAAAAFGVGDAELALACASHAGEPLHTEAVMAWLGRIGAREEDLACGPHPPHHAPTAEALVRRGVMPTRRHNNCSGKHTGFLTLARHLGAPFAGYHLSEHPVQRAVRVAVAQMAGVAEMELVAGVDGCAVPNYAMPLRSLATAMARLAAPGALPPARGAAARRLFDAVAGHPLEVSGTGRADAVLIAAAAGRAVTKTGAEGVYCAVLRDRGLGLALKIDDGATRAAETAVAAALIQLGVVAADAPGIAALSAPEVLNTRGETVGARAASGAFAVLAQVGS